MLRKLIPAASSSARRLTTHHTLRDRIRHEERELSPVGFNAAVGVLPGGRPQEISEEAWILMANSCEHVLYFMYQMMAHIANHTHS